MDILFLFIALFILIAFSVPVGLAIGGATILTMIIFSDLPLFMIGQYAITGVNSFPMMAIPFFICAGIVMSVGGIARRLVDVAANCIGFVTGGLGAVVGVASMFFGAISGSAMATVSSIGSILIPEMARKGYEKGYAAAITACAGTIGAIIPPSIPLVIYGVATQTSIGDLFIGGIIPGILMGVGIIIANYICCKRNGYEGEERKSIKEILRSIWDAKWALLSPIIILGGIYSGIFSPTESAVIGVVYAVIVSVLIYREIKLKDIFDALVETACINGITSFLLGLSTGFAAYLSMEQVPAKLFDVLLNITDNKIIFLLIVNVALLILGCVIDNIPAAIIISPILLPVMTDYGVDPVHFGIFMTINLMIGLITPPYGCNLFVGAAVAHIKFEEILRYLMPFFIALVVVLLIITYVPWLTTVLL